MPTCAYCQMAARDVDPEFAPEAPALDGDQTCTECDYPALLEHALVKAERTLGWRQRWANDELEGVSKADSIAETIERAWGSAA